MTKADAARTNIAVEIRALVDGADRCDVELTMDEIYRTLDRDTTEGTVRAAVARMLKAKQLKKKRPKVKRERVCFVYVAGPKLPEAKAPGRYERPPAHEGFMARRRRLDAALARKRARAAA